MKNELREKYDTFIYDSYDINIDNLGIKVSYKYKITNYEFNPVVFIDNKYISNKNIDMKFLECLFFNYGIINAINYYKLTCAKKMIINAGYLNDEQKTFFKKLFYNGLGEFFYVNNLDLTYGEFLDIETVKGENTNNNVIGSFNGNLVPIGGGKDSIVTIEKLKGYDNTCFIYKRNIYPDDQATLNTIKLSNNEFVSFNVTLDSLMLQLNKEGFLNGHIPFSSCLAFASFIMAYLNNKKYIVLSNEASANESNIKGTNINHQYSKSFEFEKDFREYTSKYLTDKIEYFSLLRCWNEFQIVKEFLKYPKYLNIFRSCNKGSKTNSWCSDCSKCLYVFIMLYPYIEEKELLKIFKTNMLDENKYKDMFIGLVSDNENKPFECVGTKEEINYALTLSLNKKDKLPYLLQYYKDNLYNKSKKYNIENYYNENNFIPKEYLERLKNEK